MDGNEVALADVAAEGRRYPEWGEREAIEHVRARLSPDLTLEEFIAENVADPILAQRRTEVLRRGSKPFAGTSQSLSEY